MLACSVSPYILSIYFFKVNKNSLKHCLWGVAVVCSLLALVIWKQGCVAFKEFIIINIFLNEENIHTQKRN